MRAEWRIHRRFIGANGERFHTGARTPTLHVAAQPVRSPPYAARQLTTFDPVNRWVLLRSTSCFGRGGPGANRQRVERLKAELEKAV